VPYLTMSDALRLAAQLFGRDVTKLSCCAAWPLASAGMTEELPRPLTGNQQ
jgi:hypothetical protein